MVMRPGSGAIKARRSQFWSQSHSSSIYSFTESEIEIKSEIVSLPWPRSLVHDKDTFRTCLVAISAKDTPKFDALFQYPFAFLDSIEVVLRIWLPHGGPVSKRSWHDKHPSLLESRMCRALV